MKSTRAAVLGAALTAVVSTLGLVPTSPAAAAAPRCTVQESWESSSAGVGLVWVPRSSSDTARCTLRQNDNNRAVYALQDAIVHCYHISIAVDGDFGPHTARALRTVQGQIGTAADGIYGPHTAGLIKMRPVDSSAACGRL